MRGWLKGAGVFVLLCAGAWLFLRLRVAHERTGFERVCAHTAGATFRQAGGLGSDDRDAISLEMRGPERLHRGSFSVRPGWSARRFDCNFAIEGDRVVAPQVQVHHDMDRCADRDSYPRRWWVCRLGRVLIP